MTYSKELHDRVRENLHMFDYPRFDDGDIHGLLDEIERLQKLVDAKQNRCAELESRLDLYHGNMYDVVCQENDKLQSALTTAQEENKKLLSALISMCEQYIQNEDGTLFHMFMSAGEEATELLEDMGYLTCDNRENYSWTDKRQSALNGGK